MISRALLVASVAALMAMNSPSAQAQGIGGFFKGLTSAVKDGEANDRLVATIWVDPDGCEHWVMDDGQEGYMSAHLDKSGKPVCRAVLPPQDVCLTLDSAATFASGSAAVTPKARKLLKKYFAGLVGKRILVDGHTDALGDTAGNVELSLKRAVAVANIGQEMGVIAEPRGFGEQSPIASNETAAGRASNRRVELSCS